IESHLQTVGWISRQKNFSATSRRRSFFVDIPFYRTSYLKMRHRQPASGIQWLLFNAWTGFVSVFAFHFLNRPGQFRTRRRVDTRSLQESLDCVLPHARRPLEPPNSESFCSEYQLRIATTRVYCLA